MMSARGCPIKGAVNIDGDVTGLPPADLFFDADRIHKEMHPKSISSCGVITNIPLKRYYQSQTIVSRATLSIPVPVPFRR
jgi:hypothetical protein